MKILANLSANLEDPGSIRARIENNFVRTVFFISICPCYVLRCRRRRSLLYLTTVQRRLSSCVRVHMRSMKFAYP